MQIDSPRSDRDNILFMSGIALRATLYRVTFQGVINALLKTDRPMEILISHSSSI